MKPSAVTGLGIVSAIGTGREAFFEALRAAPTAAPTNGVHRKVESFDGSKYPGAKVAEVPGFDPSKYLGEKGLRTLDRLTKLLVVAARLAMHDAGIKKEGQYVRSAPERVGLVCSNAYGSLEAITELDRVATLEDARYINPAKFPNTVSNSAAGYASIWEDLRAVNVSVSDGNCGALDAVACAEIFLDTKRADVLLVGGAEAMSEALFMAFHKLGALLGPSSRMGEGAVLFATEPRESAAKSGARILGELAGYGTAFVAPERELLHASSEALERAIAGALADAGIGPGEIDAVASGLSGLPAFDVAELAALDRQVPGVCVAAPKLLLGETLGAGGAMAMATALGWFQGARPHPIVRGAVPEAPPRKVLVTSMGYYGNASAVVMQSG